MNSLVELPLDHPLLPSHITLVVETWLSFAWAGAGHALGSIAVAGLFPRTADWINGENGNTHVTLAAIAFGSWTAYSLEISDDYRLHYRHDISLIKRTTLQLAHLGGFLVTRRILAQHASKLAAPLFYMIKTPPLLLSIAYAILVLWMVWRMIPEMTVVSSHGLTLPKFIARNMRIPFEVFQDMHRSKMAAFIMGMGDALGGSVRKPYKYAPIGTPRTIRLLLLEPQGREMSCCLKTVNLDEAPAFWAVSYLWGSEEKPMMLKVTDSASRGIAYVPITMNCAAAVLALVPMQQRYLWIDAICIDQSNILEKQQQVPLMGEIYSRAALVVGHLCTQNEIPLGFLVHRMVQILARKKRVGMNSLAADLVFGALGQLFWHEYFQRAWILQEIVLAKPLILIYGKDCIYFDHLLLIAKVQYHDLRISSGVWPVPSTECQRGQGWVDMWQHLSRCIVNFAEQAMIAENLRRSLRQNKRLTVAQIVDQTPTFGATNLRDRVYAMLALASDSSVPELQPDYSLDISNKDIFTKISWYYLRDGHRLNLFLSAGLPTQPLTGISAAKRTPALPSWAYDFASGPNRGMRLGNWAADLERSRNVALTCQLSSSMDQLSIRGIIIDRIAVHGLELPFHVRFAAERNPHVEFRDMESAIATIKDITRSLTQANVPDPYPGGMERNEALWRTMVMDNFYEQSPAPAEVEALVAMVFELTPLIFATPRPHARTHEALKCMSVEKAQKTVQVLLDIVVRVWMAYSFIVLESGYMGWAPLGVQRGDVLCLFEGCIVPFALRPIGKSDIFHLLGDGYVHGFLPGQQPGPIERPKQWLKLV